MKIGDWRNLQRLEAFKLVNTWVQAYPNATEDGARKFILRNQVQVRLLIPGRNNPCHESWHEFIDNQIAIHEEPFAAH